MENFGGGIWLTQDVYVIYQCDWVWVLTFCSCAQWKQCWWLTHSGGRIGLNWIFYSPDFGLAQLGCYSNWEATKWKLMLSQSSGIQHLLWTSLTTQMATCSLCHFSHEILKLWPACDNVLGNHYFPRQEILLYQYTVWGWGECNIWTSLKFGPSSFPLHS